MANRLIKPGEPLQVGYDGNKTVAWGDVGWQPKEIKAPGVLPMKISAAIRIGKQMIGGLERHTYKFCALGCAWAGLKGEVLTDQVMYEMTRKHGLESFGYEYISKELGISVALGEKINHKHCAGKSALQIADWLESKGY